MRCFVHENVQLAGDEFRETLTNNVEGNPERSQRYTFGTCRD